MLATNQRDSMRLAWRWRNLPSLVLAYCLYIVSPAAGQDILFVTQPPFGSDFTTINSTFGNHLGHTGAAPRGGDLYLRYADGTLRNLTAEAGFGLQAGEEIAVREPSVHWSGERALFSMVVGGTIQNDVTPTYWQIYEVSGLAAGETVQITKLSQPESYNNVSPLYGPADRILFTSDRPRDGNPLLYPQLDEYESAPTNTGLWSMNPDGSDLRLLDHAVSGVFTPIVASDGRILATRWDHLQRDQQNYSGAPYGAFNYVSETSTETTGDADEVFPEPRSRPAGSNIHGHRINIFLPWQIFADGTGHETLNHVGRHELSHYFDSARDGLPEFIAPSPRRTADRIFHVAEDPQRPGYFFATYAPEFQTHSAGQIIGLAGAEDVNPDDMEIDYVTDPISDAPAPEGSPTPADHPGLFRNPLPLSDGRVVAVRTTEARPDRRTSGALSSRYDFHLVELDPGDPYHTPGSRLIPGGISKSISYFDNYSYSQHSYDGPLWELDPVEIRSRTRPQPRTNPLPAIEAAVLAEELGADGVAGLRAFLDENELALIVSRDVTRRADRQQEFNLRVAGGGVETAEPGSEPAEIAFLQLYQGDQIRAYSGFNNGRRILATELHDGLLPPEPGVPPASVRVHADGSVAAFVPANRALTWELTDANGGSLVRERYWVTFARGEIRVCANCHGLNRTDVVLGEGPPTNPPQALRELVRWWQASYAPDPTPTPASWSLSGRVLYDGSGVPVAGADLAASGESGSQTAASDASGAYTLDGLAQGDWQLTATKLGDRAGAITAYDAAMVLRATLGLAELDPLAAVACDVTGNGSVSALDATRILQISIGTLARAPLAEECGSDFVFAPSGDPNTGEAAVQPVLGGCSGSWSFTPLAADVANRDLVARLIGDCSGNWSGPAAVTSTMSRSRARVVLGRARPRGRRYLEIPIELRSRVPFHSLELRIELGEVGAATRFRGARIGSGAMLRHQRDAGGITIAMASGPALPPGRTLVGSLWIPAGRDARAWRRSISVEASVDDALARVRRR